MRRIKERDHLDARMGARMPFINEQALIHLIENGEVVAGLLGQRLGFQGVLDEAEEAER